MAHPIKAFVRWRAAGLTVDNRCGWPITQTTLAETTGLTPVHVFRTLQTITAQGLLGIESRTLHIPVRKRRWGGTVTENDLHFDYEASEIDSNDTQGGCQLRDGDAAGIDAAIPGCN